MKKLFFLTLVSVLIGFRCNGQEEVFEKTVQYDGQRIDLQTDLANRVKVTNWDKAEVKFKVTYEVNKGDLNEIVEFDFRNQNNRVRLKLEVDQKKIRGYSLGDCEEENTMWLGNSNRSKVCSKIEVEIFLPQGTDLNIETIIGDVEVAGEFKELYVKTVTGDVDITWPEADGAEIEVKTVNGSIYTDFEFERKDKGLPVISTHSLETIYKNKERYLRLETVTSDIYLRKG